MLIVKYRVIPSHMVCHAAMEHVIHLTIHAKKTKTRRFEVPGTWPHPHCSCTPGQCPRILSPFTISNWQNQMNLKKLTTSQRFGTKSWSSVWHTSWSAFPMFAVQQEDVHIGLHFTHAIQFSDERHSRLTTLVLKRLYKRYMVSVWFDKTIHLSAGYSQPE